MNLTLKQLFDAGIIHEDDDLIIKQNGKIVIDTRKFISPEIRNTDYYMKFPIERMYAKHGTNVGDEALLIRISDKEVQE